MIDRYIINDGECKRIEACRGCGDTEHMFCAALFVGMTHQIKGGVKAFAELEKTLKDAIGRFYEQT